MHAVQWHRASAFEPDTYRDLIAGKSAVVHTLGILLEDAGYKDAIARGDVLGLLGSVVRGATGSGPASNPLKTAKEERGTYEAMNRDSGESRRGAGEPQMPRWRVGVGARRCHGGVWVWDPAGARSQRQLWLAATFRNCSSIEPKRKLTTALTVLDTMLAAPSPPAPADRSFVYVSAANKVAPFVPDRYVETKREAEIGILGRCAANGHVLPVIIRPGECSSRAQHGIASTADPRPHVQRARASCIDAPCVRALPHRRVA